MKTAALIISLLCLAACKPTPTVTQRTDAPAPQAWQYLTVDMGYLVRSNYLKGITTQWYEIDGQECYLAEGVAAQLSKSGWELVSHQLTGRVSFKRSDTGQPITAVALRSRSRYE